MTEILKMVFSNCHPLPLIAANSSYPLFINHVARSRRPRSSVLGERKSTTVSAHHVRWLAEFIK